jgi:serine/threonine-protein kinase
VEYFNFDCHACRQAYALTKKIINKYPRQVRLYLKNLPFDGVCNKYVREKGDGLTCDAALISISLRGRSEYKPFIDGIMSVNDNLSPALLDKAVAYSGIKRTAIPSMIKSTGYKNILSAEIEEAARLNIQGTPTIVINGRQLPAGLPPENFLEKIIQMEINRAYGTN